MKKQELIKLAKKVFQKEKSIKLAYLFGSRVKKEEGPLSDFDFAIYLDEKKPQKRFKTQLKTIANLSQNLNTDHIDLVVINDLEHFEFKYEIIKEGEIIYKVGSYDLEIEPRIMNEFFDFRSSLLRNGLTKKS